MISYILTYVLPSSCSLTDLPGRNSTKRYSIWHRHCYITKKQNSVDTWRAHWTDLLHSTYVFNTCMWPVTATLSRHIHSDMHYSFLSCPKAIPLPDHASENVACASMDRWVTRFSCTSVVKSERVSNSYATFHQLLCALRYKISVPTLNIRQPKG